MCVYVCVYISVWNGDNLCVLYGFCFLFFLSLLHIACSVVLRLNLCYDFVRLHPLLHVVAEQCGDVEQDHERAGNGQRQHRRLRGAWLDDGNGLVCRRKRGGMIRKSYSLVYGNERNDGIEKDVDS